VWLPGILHYNIPEPIPRSTELLPPATLMGIGLSFPDNGIGLACHGGANPDSQRS